jgi:hypothetical protein
LFTPEELVNEFVKDFNAGWQPKETLWKYYVPTVRKNKK